MNTQSSNSAQEASPKAPPKASSLLDLLPASTERSARGAITCILRGQVSDAVEDVLQEAKLSALKHASQFRGQSAYGTWFYRIAINQALMYRRRADTRRLVTGYGTSLADADAEFFETVDKVPSPEPNPLEQMLGQERNKRLWQAVERLSPKLQETLKWYLYREEGRGAKSQDSLRDRPLSNTEKARLFRAKEQLRKILTEEPI